MMELHSVLPKLYKLTDYFKKAHRYQKKKNEQIFSIFKKNVLPLSVGSTVSSEHIVFLKDYSHYIFI